MNAVASQNIPYIFVTLDTAVVVVVVIVVIVGMVMIRGCNQHKASDTNMLSYNKITCSLHILPTNTTDTYHPKLIGAD